MNVFEGIKEDRFVLVLAQPTSLGPPSAAPLEGKAKAKTNNTSIAFSEA